MPRMTFALAQVLQALDAGYTYGFDIADATSLRGGTVYPLLRRLEAEGLVASTWEAASASRDVGRPARKYYRLKPAARPQLTQARERFPFRAVARAPRTQEG